MNDGQNPYISCFLCYKNNTEILETDDLGPVFPQLFSKTHPTTHILQEEGTKGPGGGERGQKRG